MAFQIIIFHSLYIEHCIAKLTELYENLSGNNDSLKWLKKGNNRNTPPTHDIKPSFSKFVIVKFILN